MTNLVLSVIVVVGVLALWLGVALRRARHAGDDDAVNRDRLNVAIHHEQRESLLAEADDSERDSLATELDLKLLDEVSGEPAPAESTPSATTKRRPLRSSWQPYVFAGVVALATAILYWFVFGHPNAAQLADVPRLLNEAKSEDDYKQILSLIENDLQSNPTNLGGWYYLISLSSLMDDHDTVLSAHEKAEAAGLIVTETDVAYLRAAFAVRRVDLSERDLAVLVRLEKQIPFHPDVLQIKMYRAISQEDFLGANRLAEQLLRQQLDPRVRSLTSQVQQLIHTRLRRSNIPRHTVNVTLNGIFPEHNWLTVIARGRTGPPVAVLQRPLSDSQRFVLILDDSTAMVEDHVLSVQPEIQVTARLSPNSNAEKQPDDIELTSEWLDIGKTRTSSFAFQRETPNKKTYLIVSLGAKIQLGENKRVYVIVRESGGTGPPLAVKLVESGNLPITIEITSDDAMTLDGTISEATSFEVMARASASGNALRQVGDIESEVELASLGDTVELWLNRRVESLTE